MAKLKCNVGEYGIIINKKNEFLILRLPKSKDFPTEPWMFPGGRMEESDQPESGLKREILEETELKVKIIQPVHVAMWGIENPMKYAVFFLCKLMSNQKEKISLEHKESKWVGFDEIGKINWHNINSKIAITKVKKLLLKKI